MKEPWEWTEEDVLNLIRNKIGESTSLEYKACDALGKTDGKKQEISRDVSSFANSSGGVIVYGVTEDRDTHEPDAIDVGYDPRVVSGEWLEQVINSTIERRIAGVVINTVALPSTRPGRVLYVVYVPESNLAPHMAADDRFYRRFNFQRLAMKEYEVRNLMRREQYPSREIAVAWRDAVINPLLHLLRNERAYLETKKWDWDIYRGGLQGLQYLNEWARGSGDKEVFLELHARVRSGMKEYDRKLAEVYSSCDELFEQIRASGFLLDLYRQTTTPEALEPLRVEFHAQMSHVATPEALLSNLFGDTSEERHLRVLSQYVVGDVESLGVGFTTTAPFWNTYGAKFRKLTTYPPLLAHKEKADGAREQLLKSVNALAGELTAILKDLGRQHGIPVDTPPPSYPPGAYGLGYFR